MSILQISLVFGVGIFVGFLNTLGGGGAVLTLPLLIFMGLPSAVANGTNRFSVTIQSFVAAANFRRLGYFDWKLSLLFGTPAVIGSILGSFFAISLSDEIFNRILAFVMFGVLYLIIKQPKYDALEEGEFDPKNKLPAIIIFFLIGFYGGIIQAGVGFVIIAALSILTKMSLVRINGLKTFIIGVYMTFSLLIFIWSGNIDWPLAIALAAGASLGGWIGANFAVSKGDRWVKIALAIMITIMAIKLLFNI